MKLNANNKFFFFLKNLFFLYFSQAFNLVYPLLIFPYISKIFGENNFGVFSYVLTIIVYFEVFIDYGFSLSGVAKLAAESDVFRKQIIFVRIVTTKIILFICGFFVVMLFGIFSEGFYLKIFLFSSLLYLFGQAINPVWYFQALLLNEITAYSNVLSKILFTLYVYMISGNSENFSFLMLFYSLSVFLSSIFSFYVAFVRLGKPNIVFQMSNIVDELIGNFALFMSKFGVLFYTSVNLIIYKFIFNDFSSLGKYSLVEKVSQVYFSIFSTIIMIFIPTYIKIEKKKKIMLQFHIYILIFSAIVCSCIYIYSYEICFFLNGYVDERVVNVLKILSLDIFYPLGALLTQYLIIHNKPMILQKTIVITIIINSVLAIPIINFYNIEGMAIMSVVLHSLMFFIALYYLIKPKLTFKVE